MRSIRTGATLVAVASTLGLAASCSGPRATRTEAGAPLSSAAPDPTGTSPPGELDEEIAALEALAARACACRDDACFHAVNDDLAGVMWRFALPDPLTGAPSWSDAQGVRRGDAIAAIADCFETTGHGTPTSFVILMVREARALRDLACACRDVACAAEVARALADVPVDVLPQEMPRRDDVHRAFRDGRACLAPYADALDAEAIAAMTALRDQACACADPGCAQAALAAGAGRIDTLGEAPNAEMVRLSDEYTRCVLSAMGASPPAGGE